jgi:hypothetical protein
VFKKIALVAAVTAAGMALFGGMASATTWSNTDTLGHNGLVGQVGLANLNNLDALHNVNVNPGVCDNDINVLGVQVPVRDVANGIGIPVLTAGRSTAAGDDAHSCASGTIVDGGTGQAN